MKEKINQLDFVLDYFNDIYKEAGVHHLQPVRCVRNKEEIDNYVLPHNISPIHLKCLFSGNYYKPGTTDLDVDRQNIQKYLVSFLGPALSNIQEPLIVGCRILGG